MSETTNTLTIKVESTVSIAHLIEFGEQKGYVTYDDILRLLPEVE